MNEVLRLEHVSHLYSAGTPFEKRALNDVSFSARAGEFIALIGHTGSGKSTLVQHLNGLIRPTSGRVLIDGEDIFSSKELTRAARFAVGLVFQYPEYQLFEETVYKDIAFGPKNMGLESDEIDRRVRRATRMMGLEDGLLDKSPFELSGGQRRRVALAGIFAMEPEVLVLDEPMAGLDPGGRDDVFRYISDYREKYHATVILVTHSMEDAARMAERILVLQGGEIVLDGAPAEIFEHTQLLIDSGLDVPQVTHVFRALRARGVDVPEAVYTVEQAAGLLRALREKEAPSC